MPNYCENSLEVRGNRQDVEAFLSTVKGEVSGDQGPLDFNTVLPYPAEFRQRDREAKAWEEAWHRRGNPAEEWKDRPQGGFNSGGYEWCWTNWGTKWNAIDPVVKDFRRGAARLSFDTAWSPPLPWVLAASRRWPKLKFTLRYWESGMGFKGVFAAAGGEVLNHESSEYHGSRGG